MSKPIDTPCECDSKHWTAADTVLANGQILQQMNCLRCGRGWGVVKTERQAEEEQPIFSETVSDG